MPAEVKFSLETIEDAINDGGIGFCKSCGEQSEEFCEPDARNYACFSCEENEVFGASELLIMGLVED